MEWAIRALEDIADTVVAIGRDAAKGAALTRLGAHFIGADLSSVAENRRVVDLLTSRYEAIDALVLCARYFRSHRHETPEGFEACFALEYLSRFLLGHQLLGLALVEDAGVANTIWIAMSMSRTPPPIRTADSVMPSRRSRSSPNAAKTVRTTVANTTALTAIQRRSPTPRFRASAANTGTFLNGATVTRNIANAPSATALIAGSTESSVQP